MKQLAFIIGISIAITACSGNSEPEVRDVYYQPAFRTEPPEPVYGRVTWSHLPGPTPPAASGNVPYLLPVLSVELPNSNLEEAVLAIAQTMGYRAIYPGTVRNRKISISREGTLTDLLEEIERQARVTAEVNHRERLVRIIDPETVPNLPAAQ